MSKDISIIFNKICDELKTRLKDILNQKEIENLIIAIKSLAILTKTNEEFIILLKKKLPIWLLLFDKETNKFKVHLLKHIPELNQRNDYYIFMALSLYLINQSTIENIIDYKEEEKRDLFIKIVTNEERKKEIFPKDNNMSPIFAEGMLKELSSIVR